MLFIFFQKSKIKKIQFLFQNLDMLLSSIILSIKTILRKKPFNIILKDKK